VPVASLPSIQGLATGFIRCDHPIALMKSTMEEASIFGHLEIDDMRRVDDALRRALDL
jgi:hypothetical protein